MTNFISSTVYACCALSAIEISSIDLPPWTTGQAHGCTTYREGRRKYLKGNFSRGHLCSVFTRNFFYNDIIAFFFSINVYNEWNRCRWGTWWRMRHINTHSSRSRLFSQEFLCMYISGKFPNFLPYNQL